MCQRECPFPFVFPELLPSPDSPRRTTAQSSLLASDMSHLILAPDVLRQGVAGAQRMIMSCVGVDRRKKQRHACEDGRSAKCSVIRQCKDFFRESGYGFEQNTSDMQGAASLQTLYFSPVDTFLFAHELGSPRAHLNCDVSTSTSPLAARCSCNSLS